MSELNKGKQAYTKLTKDQRAFYDAMCIRAMNSMVGAPYLRAQIVLLYPVATTKVWAAAVDKRQRVYLNFDFLQKKGIEWAAGALIHESWHVLLRHFDRHSGTAHPSFAKWGKATDLEINQNLPVGCRNLMTEILYPQNFNLENNKTAEFYYDQLPDEEKDDSKKDKGEGGVQDSDDDTGDGQGDNDGDSEDGDGGAPSNGFGDCGSASGGNQRDYEVDNDAAPERSELDKEYARNEVAKAIVKQAQAEENNKSKSIGTMPAFAKLWAEKQLEPPKVRWQSVLSTEYTQVHRRSKAGRTNVHPNRPARRQPVEDIMFPKRKSHKVSVGIAVDTSGSNLDNIPYVFSEINAIIRRGGVDAVYFFSVDAAVSEPKKLRTVNDVEFIGGGGTDMRLAFDTFDELRVDIGIIITDSQTPWVTEDRAFRSNCKYIIAGLVGTDYEQQAFDEIPEFLTKVKIDLESN